MTTATYDNSVLEDIRGILSQADMTGRMVDENEELLMSGVLDSLKIVKLVASVEQHFDCSINASEVLPENFETAMAIAVYLASKSKD